MARVRLICGNWKMHKTVAEAVALARDVRGRVADLRGREVVVCPPFTALHAVHEALAGGPVALGSQDVFWEDQGAFTGEVSAPMLADVGCTFVIVGHSERRHLLGETDAQVARKTAAVLRHGLVPIVCVGETLAERESGATESVLARQVRESLAGIEASAAARLVVAYEPVWAIGTGKTATEAQAQAAHAHVRTVLAERFGQGGAAAIRILYGGSVKPDNAAGLFRQPDVDGALVGGASLDAEGFARICRAE